MIHSSEPDTRWMRHGETAQSQRGRIHFAVQDSPFGGDQLVMAGQSQFTAPERCTTSEPRTISLVCTSMVTSDT